MTSSQNGSLSRLGISRSDGCDWIPYLVGQDFETEMEKFGMRKCEGPPNTSNATTAHFFCGVDIMGRVSLANEVYGDLDFTFGGPSSSKIPHI
ncbi:unnamed protein product [Dovyalis caffra]|uniref:Uncharacterized protein n=1 Tax=Dovyalis caffra TaxID=77055 RepID=A0AAV1RIE9_9ROSI|nr:unnamed protein product [Dovyalis caffra]